MSRLAALGRRHFVGCFAALGARTVPCETPAAFDQAVAALAEGEAPALVLVDQAFAACTESLARLRGRGAIVVLLPAEPSQRHPALDEMRAVIEAAAGANILGEY
jgi:vacuolar-type H+-ATPase subunit F/Vma7